VLEYRKKVEPRLTENEFDDMELFELQGRY